MLKVIEDQPAIKKYAGQFNKKFKPFVNEEIKVKLGHQGASFPAKVSWSSSLGIGNLASGRFALQAAQFVKKIEMLKSSAAASAQIEMDFSEIIFREDLIGSETPLSENEIISACDHDLVVSKLAGLLQQQKIKIGNDTENELFTSTMSRKYFPLPLTGPKIFR